MTDTRAVVRRLLRAGLLCAVRRLVEDLGQPVVRDAEHRWTGGLAQAARDAAAAVDFDIHQYTLLTRDLVYSFLLWEYAHKTAGL